MVDARRLEEFRRGLRAPFDMGAAGGGGRFIPPTPPLPEEEEMAIIGFTATITPIGPMGAGKSYRALYTDYGSLPGGTSISIPVPRNGTVRSLHTHIEVGKNTLNGPLICSVVLNGVVQPLLQVTYAAGETGLKSALGSVAVSVGDLLAFEFDATGATLGSVFPTASVELLPS